MKNYFFIALCLNTLITFGQKTKFSIEASYPLPIDNNFIGEYKGIADFGIKYKIKNLEQFNFGVSLNSAYYTFEATRFFPAFDENLKFNTSLYTIQPRFFCEMNLKKVTKLHPYAGIGYTFLIFKTKFSSPEVTNPNSSNNQSGLNINLGANYDLTNRFYVNVAYDYLKILELESNIPKSSYNTNASIVKLGVGFRI